MEKERLYQFAVIKHPTSEERKQGKRSEIIVRPSGFLLAHTEQEVVMRATKSIPDEHMDHANRLEVAVRPF